jgi:lysozyme
VSRRLILDLALAAGMATASPAFAQDIEAKALDVATLLREVESAAALAGGLRITTSAPALRVGKSLVLTIELPQPGYLNVVSINPAGEPTVLFPNGIHTDNRVAAGRFEFPTAQMGFRVRASAPYGESRIAAFLSSDPMDLHAIGHKAAGGPGAALAHFAQLSLEGRDLISLFGSLVLEGASQPRLHAGLARVTVCAPAGACKAAGRAAPDIKRIVDAQVPGILLDKAGDRAPAAGPLRPVFELGLRLTKASEGFVPRLYHDAAGYCTIAYGHLMRLGRCVAADRQRYPSDIEPEHGEELLVGDLAHAQRAVQAYVKVPLTDGQYASLVDFTYNVGAGNLKRSTLLRVVNEQARHRVPAQFGRWVKAGGRELRGLRIRREREVQLFFAGQPIPKVVPKDENIESVDIREGEPSR